MADAHELSRYEDILVRFLNAPFVLVIPVLLATIAGMAWTFSQQF